MKKKLFSMLALLCLTVVSAWAEQTYTVTFSANANEWTFTMPDSDVELDEVEYYTDLKEDEAIDYSAIGTTADIWLCRTLKAGSYNTFASPVAIDADGITPTVVSGVVSFIPVLQKTQVTADVADILFLGASNTLLNPSAEGQYIKGFRAYFQVADGANARSFVLNFGDGEASGIRSLTTSPSPVGEGSIYTLDGRRVSNATKKGVYIENGKKIVIK